MTSNKYVVSNCPAILRMTKVCDAYETTRDLPQFCKDRTDCVVKRVIEKCKDMASGRDYYAYDFANEILQLFDIEEINK